MSERSRLRPALTLFVVCMGSLLLEVGYTRIVSYKLWYYYTYLVIGLALLGIGSGGIALVVSKRIKAASTESIVIGCGIWGGVSVAIGYLVIARIGIDTVQIWDYGTRASITNFLRLGVICFILFASFVAVGLVIATILGRAVQDIGRLYFADLAGAALGCVLAIPIISWVGPPALIIFAAFLIALPAVWTAPVARSPQFVAAGLVVVVLAGVAVNYGVLPNIKAERTKQFAVSDGDHSEWGPVFRVDAVFLDPDGEGGESPAWLLVHDGTFGARMNPWDGNVENLTRYDTDPRALPYRTMAGPPDSVVIIGSAGGNEILASLRFGAKKIEGVELNPVTVSLLEKHFKEETGDLDNQPGVDIINGDGRSFLARSDEQYDLVWYVAPDSYAANNAASSGAFVLSESYLYTTKMITDTLEHLTDDGMMVAQFGELNYADRPNRTARYVSTARKALRDMGVEDPSQHIMVSNETAGDLSTIMLKRTPFTEEEVERFAAATAELPNTQFGYAPGRDVGPGLAPRLAAAKSEDEAKALRDTYPRSVSAITDDSPFFWHFVPFNDVIGDFFDPVRPNDPEEAIGERVLLLLLLIAALYAAIFLLLPFVLVRKEWRALPGKRTSFLYFACLGLGFMFLEITLIQRLTRFLGYPTYSLTVTIASILISTGLGALASKRLAERFANPMPFVYLGVVLLVIFYQFGFDQVEDALLTTPLSFRIFVAFLVCAPLGFCLGMFMPLGLTRVGTLPEHGDEYVAWAWAVNGFFSVIGSVLTTILAMEFGFRAVQLGALVVYAIAVLTYQRLRAVGPPAGIEPVVPDKALALDPTPVN
jgi:hypothetical protein